MKKLLSLILVSSSFSAFAVAGDSPWTAQQETENYCKQSGGEIKVMQAQFTTNSGSVNGVSKSFCRYNINGNLAYLGLDTLSTTPTLAATYTQKLRMRPGNVPTTPYQNPSLNVCQQLQGSEIGFAVPLGGFADNYGQADICVFGDGSSISAWTMIYSAEHTDPKVKLQIIRSKPMDIDIPRISN